MNFKDWEDAERVDIPDEVYHSAPRIKMSRRAIIKGMAAGTVVPIAAGCVTNPVTGQNQFILVGNSQLASMSAAAWSEMRQQTPEVRDPALRRRVMNVWERTANGRSDFLNTAYNPNDWEVAIFDTDDVNAFVMPGQQVGIYRGITELTENDDQLASVLGHEAGHVDGRHSAERASLQLGSQVVMTAGAIAITSNDELAQYGGTIAALGGAALQFGVLLPYSRRHELEADRLGVDYMHAGGYDVSQSIRLWELMDAQSAGQRPPEWMSTHPNPGRRADELRNYINARGYALV
ncbi:MAG: M48 family metallopeptidase [Pseudomonadota bacterium]